MKPLMYWHIIKGYLIGYRFVPQFLLLVLYLFGTQEAFSDEVVLTTGEKFTSSKVWEEDGKIRFNMHGLVVSVNKSDIATIIGKDGIGRQFSAPAPKSQRQPAPPSVPPNQKAPIPVPSEKPLAKAMDPPQAPQSKSAPTTSQTPTKNKRNGIGIKGIRWLASPAEIPDLEKMKKDPAYGGIDQYWRPNEQMQFGRALLDGRIYGFWRNKLYSVMMWAEGRLGYERLQEAVLAQFGQGRKNSKGMERYVWLDATTDRMLQFDTELNTGFFWMRSRRLDAQIKKLYPNE